MADQSFTYKDEDVLVNPQATALIDAKYEHKTFEFVRSQRQKKRVFRGVKEVKKALRRNQKGLLVLAADTHPFDVISFLPVKAEKLNVPYFFVKSKRVLSAACGTMLTASAVLVQRPDDAKDLEDFNKLVEKAKMLQKKQQTTIFTD